MDLRRSESVPTPPKCHDKPEVLLGKYQLDRLLAMAPSPRSTMPAPSPTAPASLSRSSTSPKSDIVAHKLSQTLASLRFTRSAFLALYFSPFPPALPLNPFPSSEGLLIHPRSFPGVRASVMVEELASKPQPNEGDVPETVSSVDMEMESSSPKIPGGSEPLVIENGAEKPAEEGGGGGAKRTIEEENNAAAEEEEEDEGGALRKRMVERSLEERKRQNRLLIHAGFVNAHLIPFLSDEDKATASLLDDDGRKRKMPSNGAGGSMKMKIAMRLILLPRAGLPL